MHATNVEYTHCLTDNGTVPARLQTPESTRTQQRHTVYKASANAMQRNATQHERKNTSSTPLNVKNQPSTTSHYARRTRPANATLTRQYTVYLSVMSYTSYEYSMYSSNLQCWMCKTL